MTWFLWKAPSVKQQERSDNEGYWWRNNFEAPKRTFKDAGGQSDEVQVAGFSLRIITLMGVAIGLMNIMLIVTERTRSAGVRSFATKAFIRLQFR